MQQDYTISGGRNAMLLGGILRVCSDAFSSKSSHIEFCTNNYKQGRPIDFRCYSFSGKERDKETGYGYVFRGGRLVNSCSGGREDTKALEFIWKYISFQDIIELFSQNGTIILQPQVIVSNYINQKKKKQ